MTTTTITARADTYAEQANPQRTHGPDTPIVVAGTGGSQRESYLSIPIALPAGASVIGATLYLKTADASAGAVDLRVRKVSASWAEGKLNWNNRPATTATDEAALSVAAGAANRTIAVPITALVQGIVNAGKYYGLRLATPSANALRIRSTEATEPANRPFVVVDYAVQPPAPNGLEPAGQLVSTATPTLRWQVPGGSQVSYQVVLDDDPAFGSPSHDTGTIASVDPQHLLTITLGAGVATYWRVRITDAAGQTSPWSDPALVTYAAPPTVALTAPAASTTLLRPLVTWTYAGTYPQESFELVVFDDATGEIVQQVPRAISTALAFELAPLPRLGAYRLRLRVWDTADRAGGGSGATPYREIVQPFTQTAGAGTAITGLQADPVLPLVVLTWAGSGAGGALIRRDGVYVGQVAAGVLTWRDWGGHPGATYGVQSLDAAGSMGPLATDAIDPNDVPIGIWLVYPDDELAVQLLDTEAGDWQVGESAATLVPLAGVPLRVTANLRGYEGSISGLIVPGAAAGGSTPTGQQQRADLYVMKQASAVGRVVRLAAARENLPIVIGAMSLPPHPTLHDVYAVDIEFAQRGEFPMIEAAETSLVREGG